MISCVAPLFIALLSSAIASERVGIETKTGKVVTAEVLSLRDGTVELKVFGFGGEAIVKRSLDVFVPESVFVIELAAADPKTFDAHFALAQRAAELDLLPQAGAQARAAMELAGTGEAGDANRKKVHAWAADALEKMIHAAVSANDHDRASHALHLLTTKVPEQRTEAQLAAITEKVESLQVAARAKLAADRAAKRDAQKKAEVEKSLAPIHEAIARGDKHFAKAVAQSNDTTSSARSCEAAVEAYKLAWKGTHTLVARYANDMDVQNELGELSDTIESSALRAALHAANVLTSQSDYVGARNWVNRILKHDPGNAEAKEMLQTIQLAEADSRDYRFRWKDKGRKR
jgi:hypothetical protein